MYSNSQLTALVNEFIHSERDRQIILDRYVNGLTFAELEGRHHLSERQIKRIVKKADPLLVRLSNINVTLL